MVCSSTESNAVNSKDLIMLIYVDQMSMILRSISRDISWHREMAIPINDRPLQLTDPDH